MKRFVKHCLLFGLVFFVLDKGLYFFLNQAPKLEIDKRLEYVLEGKMNKDIIIMGSSRGADNILAKQIEQQTKRSTYNLSYPGSDIVFHDFILKTLLQYNSKPKLILLVIDNPFLFKEEQTLTFRLDRLYPLSKYNYINAELIARGEKNYLSWLFCAARINRSNFTFKTVSNSHLNPIDNWGSMPFLKKEKQQSLKFINSNLTYTTRGELEAKITAFKSMQKQCKSNGIQLLYVFSPAYRAFDISFYNRFLQLVDDQSVLVYNKWDSRYQNEEFYFDEVHLLKTGAEIFTNEISTFIRSKNVSK